MEIAWTYLKQQRQQERQSTRPAGIKRVNFQVHIWTLNSDVQCISAERKIPLEGVIDTALKISFFFVATKQIWPSSPRFEVFRSHPDTHTR